MGSPGRFLRSTAAGYRNRARALAIAGGYAAAVLGIAVFVVLAGGLAGVWLILITMPSALLVHFLPVDGDLYVLCLALGGLVQAWLLWLGLRGERLS